MMLIQRNRDRDVAELHGLHVQRATPPSAPRSRWPWWWWVLLGPVVLVAGLWWLGIAIVRGRV